jgi:hypothetical protein
MDWVLERRQPAIPGTPASNTSASLDVSPSGDRLMLTLVTPASDIWLVACFRHQLLLGSI